MTTTQVHERGSVADRAPGSAPGAGRHGRPRRRSSSTTPRRWRRCGRATLGSVHSWELVTAVDGPGHAADRVPGRLPAACLYCHNPDTMQMRRGTDVTRRRDPGARRPVPDGVRGDRRRPDDLGRRAPDAAGVRRAAAARARRRWACTPRSTRPGSWARSAPTRCSTTSTSCCSTSSPGCRTPTAASPGARCSRRSTSAAGCATAARAMWVRFVLVPGLTDAPENVEAVADHVVALGRRRRARRGAAVPPDGPRQVGRAGDALRAGGHAAPDPGARRARARDVPGPGAEPSTRRSGRSRRRRAGSDGRARARSSPCGPGTA